MKHTVVKKGVATLDSTPSWRVLEPVIYQAIYFPSSIKEEDKPMIVKEIQRMAIIADKWLQHERNLEDGNS